MNMQGKRQMKHHSFLLWYGGIFIVLLACTLWAILPLFSPPLRLTRLPDLPVPTQYVSLYLPDPLTLTHPLANVLGTEPIDPRDVITYINAERMKRDIPPLKTNETLTKAALMRAQTIIRYQNFSHIDPYEHIELGTVLPKLNYGFTWASENIGMGGTSGKDFVLGFMNSTSHRNNLLNPELKETGVAVLSGPYMKYFVNIVVQIFAIPTDIKTLGYTREDIAQYSKFLSDIGHQLIEARKLIGTDPEKKEYGQRWETLLLRQQELLTLLLTEMNQGKPFTKDILSRIEEYNANWLSVPQG